MDDAPLAGVRVVDLSRLLPGPFCTWILASLGAEVIRVEPPGGADYTRDMPPLVDGKGVFHACLNRGKKSVILDSRRDPELLERLLATADVLVEGFKPGTLKVRGHERLIVASITGYGQTGPLAAEPGHDLNYQGWAGIVAAAGEGAPWPVQVADVAGGALVGAAGIAAALYARERTGRGRHLDISMCGGALAMMGPHLATAWAEGRPLAPSGELLSGGYFAYRTWRCADGRLLTVAPLEPKFLAQLEAALGQPVDAATLGPLLATRPRDEWVERLRGCCVGPALEATELPQLMPHWFEEVLGMPMARAPFPWSPSPELADLGAHTQEILEAL